MHIFFFIIRKCTHNSNTLFQSQTLFSKNILRVYHFRNIPSTFYFNKYSVVRISLILFHHDINDLLRHIDLFDHIAGEFIRDGRFSGCDGLVF